MNADSFITIFGAVITIAGGVFALDQARKAKSYSDQIKVDVQRILLMKVTESLYRCQEEVRKLPRDRSDLPRGFRVDSVLDKVWPHFDQILSSHVLGDGNVEPRKSILLAQTMLRTYERGQTGSIVDPYDVQCLIQDSLSNISSKVFKLDGKA